MNLKNIKLDLNFVKSQFPAFNDPMSKEWTFLENAGGSYVPQTVIDRLNKFMISTKVQPYAEYPMSKIAGDEMDEAVLQWFRNEHKLEIGLGMSEKIKKTVGSAMKMKTADIAVKGRDLVSGIPKTIEVSSDEIRQALKDPVNQIVEAVKRCLEQTPPELAADILERGIILAGGGSLLKGIDQIIRERTSVPVNVSEDPLLSVVRGTGMVLENLKKYEAVLL